MIGILDPALLLPRSDAEIVQELDEVIGTCRQYGVALPPLDEYWSTMWRTLGAALEAGAKGMAQRSIQELRRLGEKSALIAPATPAAGSAWRNGFMHLFSAQYLGAPWEAPMAAAVTRACHASEQVFVFVRRLRGRNLELVSSGGSVLARNQRWLLHVQPRGLGHRQILCVYHRRNIEEPWTARFDHRLPGPARAPFPFCAPQPWWKGATPSDRTIASKPCWVDVHGNGWARPNISGGAGYHWDVYVASRFQAAIGLNQINVVQQGAPATEGEPGTIHHVPEEKRGKVKGGGWHC